MVWDADFGGEVRHVVCEFEVFGAGARGVAGVEFWVGVSGAGVRGGRGKGVGMIGRGIEMRM